MDLRSTMDITQRTQSLIMALSRSHLMSKPSLTKWRKKLYFNIEDRPTKVSVHEMEQLPKDSYEVYGEAISVLSRNHTLSVRKPILFGKLLIFAASVILIYLPCCAYSANKKLVGKPEFIRLYKSGEVIQNYIIPAPYLREALLSPHKSNDKMIVLSHCIVKGDLDLHDKTIAPEIVVGDTLFKGSVNCNGTVFKKRVDFETLITRDEIEEHIELSKVNRQGAVVLMLLKSLAKNFGEDRNKFHTVFAGEVTFDRATFHSEVTFSNVIFQDSASFKRTIFREDTHFPKVRFPEDFAGFQHAEFKGKADFDHSIFKGLSDSSTGQFYEVKFEDDTDFTEVSFQDWTVFRRVTFSGKADFSEASFLDQFDFDEVKFLKGVDFVKTNFLMNEFTTRPLGRFLDITVKEAIDFRLATFRNIVVNFSGCTFHGDAMFDQVFADKKGVFVFHGDKFQGKASFSRMHTDVLWISTRSYEAVHNPSDRRETPLFIPTVFEGSISFQGLECNELDLVDTDFRAYINISGALIRHSMNFNGTVCADDVNFQTTRFPAFTVIQPKHLGPSKGVFLDGARFAKAVHLEWEQIDNRIETNNTMTWRTLEQAFHNSGNLEGQNECMYRRRQLEEQQKRNSLFSSNFSRIFWGYGVRPYRVLCWIGITIFFFALVYLTQTKSMSKSYSFPKRLLSRFQYALQFSIQTSWKIDYGYQRAITPFFKSITLAQSIIFKTMIVCLLQSLANISPLLKELVGKFLPG